MFPAMIGAVGSLLGGLFNSSSQSAINAANVNFQRETNLQNLQFVNDMNRQANEWDQVKIQRLVADARAAGVHPLAALGSTISGSSVMPVAPSFVAPRVEGGSSMGDAIGDAVGQVATALQLERGSLENKLLRAQVSEARSRSAIAAARASAVGGPGSTMGEFVIEPQRTTHVRLPGDVMRIPSSGGSDAQSWEDRYGDVVENAAGIGNLIWDIGAMLPTMEGHGHRPMFDPFGVYK